VTARNHGCSSAARGARSPKMPPVICELSCSTNVAERQGKGHSRSRCLRIFSRRVRRLGRKARRRVLHAAVGCSGARGDVGALPRSGIRSVIGERARCEDVIGAARWGERESRALTRQAPVLYDRERDEPQPDISSSRMVASRRFASNGPPQKPHV